MKSKHFPMIIDRIMTWYDVEDILFDGTKEQIGSIRCPDCGGKIQFSYYPGSGRMVTACYNCGYYSVGYSKLSPNAYRYTFLFESVD